MATKTVIADLDGISPAEIRAGLVPEEQPEFDEDWRAACRAAAETLELAGILRVLRIYQRYAMIVERDGIDGYRELMARV